MSSPTASAKEVTESEIRSLLEAGELYRARKLGESFLKKHPKDEKAEHLMAEILEREIERHKAVMESGEPEGLSSKEKEAEARTWLERSRGMLELKQYDQALDAAERVFLYDPDNLEASKLVDEIKHKAYRQGKKESGNLEGMYRDEIQTRLEDYRREARAAVQERRWGSAQMAVTKILLLAPEDSEALQMQKKIKSSQREPQAA